MAKIDDDKLVELIHEGTSQVDCARYFGVSRSAIYQKLKKLGLKALQAQISSRTVEIVTGTNNGGVNTLQQFEHINNKANRMLNIAMVSVENVTIDDIIDSIENPTKADFVNAAKIIAANKDAALRSMAEIRKQLEFQLNMYQMLYDMRAVQEFQQEVLTAIGEAAPDVRDAILHKLKEKRVIRAALQQP